MSGLQLFGVLLNYFIFLCFFLAGLAVSAVDLVWIVSLLVVVTPYHLTFLVVRCPLFYLRPIVSTYVSIVKQHSLPSRNRNSIIHTYPVTNNGLIREYTVIKSRDLISHAYRSSWEGMSHPEACDKPPSRPAGVQSSRIHLKLQFAIGVSGVLEIQFLFQLPQHPPLL